MFIHVNRYRHAGSLLFWLQSTLSYECSQGISCAHANELQQVNAVCEGGVNRHEKAVDYLPVFLYTQRPKLLSAL